MAKSKKPTQKKKITHITRGKSNKRIEKKRQKQQQITTLRNQYTEKEIKRMPVSQRAKEEKRIDRNEARRQARQETKDFLSARGLSLSFINRNRLYDKKKESYSAADILKFRKTDALQQAGVSFSASDLRLSWEKLRDKYPTIILPEAEKKKLEKKKENSENFVFTVRDYLYIGAAEIRTGFHKVDYSDLTANEILKQIQDRISEASGSPDGSDTLYCIFIYDFGTRSFMEEKASVFYSRGYNMNRKHTKLSENQYQKLTISNRWSSHEFLSMMLNVTCQMKNEDVAPFVSRMKDYCRENGLPFLNDL